MNSKTHEIWNIHFIEQIIDTMADGVFTLDNSGTGHFLESFDGTYQRVYGRRGHEQDVSDFKMQPVFRQKMSLWAFAAVRFLKRGNPRRKNVY